MRTGSARVGRRPLRLVLGALAVTATLAAGTAPAQAGGGGDTTPPTCFVSALLAGPPQRQEVTVQDTESGLAAITNIVIVNGKVNVQKFTPGTIAAIQVTASKTNQSQQTVWSFDAVDVAGNVRHCT